MLFQPKEKKNGAGSSNTANLASAASRRKIRLPKKGI